MKARHVAIVSAIILLLLSVLVIQTALAQESSTPLLLVKKQARGSQITDWNWTIVKTAKDDEGKIISELTLSPGQEITVNYEVTVTPEGVSTWSAEGEIIIRNQSGTQQIITSVVDELSDGTLATVTCRKPLPFTLDPWKEGDVNTPTNRLICDYEASGTGTLPAENTATAFLDNGSGGEIEGGSETVAVAMTSLTETDECIDVSDDLSGFPEGFLGTVCAGDADKTFNYTVTVGPYAECGEYEFINTASFVTNDTGAGGSSSLTIPVNVPCEGGCSLTPGYWKTHSTYGPAPYDDTWAQIGEDTPFFLSGKSYYLALWTAPQGNAYWILAHAYIAAQLNDLNGADFAAAQAAFDQATALLWTYTPAQIGALHGTATPRPTFISLAATLDNYNNGLSGPGHCSE